MMTTLAWWAGATWELVTGWPWRELGGAAVLMVTIASVYVFLWLATPDGWPR